MESIGHGVETYLYFNGVSTSKEIQLHDGVTLLPVTTEFNYRKAAELLNNVYASAVATVLGRTITSQIRIYAADKGEFERNAWKAAWDSLLLGAVFQCETMGIIQCDKPVEQLENATELYISNDAIRISISEDYRLTQKDEEWILSNYSAAFALLMDEDAFSTAVHAMASYRWHVAPRVQLAVLWSGIEALFKVSSEISFRISLYIANFLAGEDAAEAKELYEKTRKLYSSRSSAVHGSKIKGDIDGLVSESAELLNRIIRRCAELGALPDTQDLVFPSAFLNKADQ